MRGRPITVAAMSADILARTLERCAVKVEILGFTTAGVEGAASRASDGSPPASHPTPAGSTICATSSTSRPTWRRRRRARKSLGLMLREGILKENIDGEALAWAHNRLLTRTEERKIL